jgi:hypothetical protein
MVGFGFLILVFAASFTTKRTIIENKKKEKSEMVIVDCCLVFNSYVLDFHLDWIGCHQL